MEIQTTRMGTRSASHLDGHLFGRGRSSGEVPWRVISPHLKAIAT